jgi:lathosterol oxidase
MCQLSLLFILNNWRWIAFAILCIAAGRYILLAGLAYMLCYRPGLKFVKRFKIQPLMPKQKQVRHELIFSLSTIFIFSSIGIVAYLLFVNGYTTIYMKAGQYGWVYLFLSLLFMVIIHDAYFYWTHRLLHTKWLFKKIHVVHHRSVNPTPWAAYSFHPFEALLESLIVFPFITIFPVHIAVFLFFTFLVLLMNVIGHLGFEFLPMRLRNSKLGKYFTSSTHHNLHHQKNKKNFGYYFTFWDNLMKTSQNQKSAADLPHNTYRGHSPKEKGQRIKEMQMRH